MCRGKQETDKESRVWKALGLGGFGHLCELFDDPVVVATDLFSRLRSLVKRRGGCRRVRIEVESVEADHTRKRTCLGFRVLVESVGADHTRKRTSLGFRVLVESVGADHQGKELV